MVMNVTSLLKTVKSVEDEATRGTRALEATIDAIVQEAKVSKLSNNQDFVSACQNLEILDLLTTMLFLLSFCP